MPKLKKVFRKTARYDRSATIRFEVEEHENADSLIVYRVVEYRRSERGDVVADDLSRIEANSIAAVLAHRLHDVIDILGGRLTNERLAMTRERTEMEQHRRLLTILEDAEARKLRQERTEHSWEGEEVADA